MFESKHSGRHINNIVYSPFAEIPASPDTWAVITAEQFLPENLLAHSLPDYMLNTPRDKIITYCDQNTIELPLGYKFFPSDLQGKERSTGILITSAFAQLSPLNKSVHNSLIGTRDVSLEKILMCNNTQLAQLLRTGRTKDNKTFNESQLPSAINAITKVIPDYLRSISVLPHQYLLADIYNDPYIAIFPKETELILRKQIEGLLKIIPDITGVTSNQLLKLRASFGLDDGLKKTPSQTAKSLGYTSKNIRQRKGQMLLNFKIPELEQAFQEIIREAYNHVSQTTGNPPKHLPYQSKFFHPKDNIR